MPTTTLENPGNSLVMNWIRDHLDYPHKDYCLIWPFGIGPGGYGQFVRDGKKIFAHRFICEVKNGPPPTPEHHATHSCNRGHDACANQHHLRWKTRSENMLEAPPHHKIKLFPAQVEEIRTLKGIETASETAGRFGVRECTIRDIQAGRTWKRGSRGKAMFHDADVQRIRALKGIKLGKELAEEYGVKPNVIYKIQLRQSWKHVPEADLLVPIG